MHAGNTLVLLAASLTAVSHAAQPAPSADILKHALTKKLQKLTPAGMTERQVLFQEVRAGTPTGASYPFQVTAVLRDYGPGYPANRFYGTTCVNHFDKARFALFRNEFGEWDVEGAMTPPLATQDCKPNPSGGVSAIPLSTLTGAAAPAGNPPPAPAPANPGGTQGSGGGVAPGRYECWANGQARLLLNSPLLRKISKVDVTVSFNHVMIYSRDIPRGSPASDRRVITLDQNRARSSVG